MTTLLWTGVALLGGSSVLLDAWFSHGLNTTPDVMSSLKTAIYYQQLNSVLVIISLILAGKSPRFIHILPAWCFTLGIIAFSGGIYGKHLMALNTGMITPAGGLITALGWILLAVSGLGYIQRSRQSGF
ncbi:DUF423 domain-containing protein [Oceanospirillum sediminis]|uniref:DUF423 domain-containing protein n=1 Tax=Oceanospirillum sediminis TaxID=2760088 RepID=A0A839INP5_9GAMM|nr:DUF423 domain-containing protein [Oceanospirillum sediminis]MBB1486511.1 DUF423 domain-containing protein [Oceanospirillum sediminis]